MAQQKSPRGPVELLTTDREKATAEWIDGVAGSLQGRISKAELDRELRELYEALVSGLAAGDETRGESLSEVRALLTELSRNRARQGFTPSETAISVLALKQALEPVMRNDSTADTTAYLRLSRVLDDLALYTIETYTRTREEIISSQAAQLMELSTPVVKLWDGVIAVPLVGTLDSARTQVVMEKLLQALVDTGSEQAIIDITGVPAVDTEVAQHLLKTVVAARLMGAECTVSGIRPQIAQTIVALGIEFGDIVTKATLADALQHALKRSGVDLVTRQGGER
ncbi:MULTISPECIES: STAS domain-containing protein [Streptomyces]|uniref:STAS domain-containing protein n=1 Tax=Streptomyces TaxID=1883 RepID=UPI000D506EE0|nr:MULTISPECIES: STAS domain-containing protein [Streptomyces]NYS18766.1 STAS domain-containing protein [Streptomyces sp. SJ1-7]PVC72794.1 anti-anti-sigma factor [Streptomyces sp. CS065A]